MPILTVDKIGMAFLELIALLVIFNDCRNKFLLIENESWNLLYLF